MHGTDENLFNVAVVALVLATGLIATGHDQGWNVQAGSGHQLARHRLVAGREADHAVQLRAFYRHFNVVGDQVPGTQHVGPAGTCTSDEVTGRGSANLKRHRTRCAYGQLDFCGYFVEVAVTTGQLTAGVDDGNFWLFAVFL